VDKVLYKWFTEGHVGGKLVTESVITGKAKSVCDELKISDRCIFSDVWL
jgi:hypothetical protein